MITYLHTESHFSLVCQQVLFFTVSRKNLALLSKSRADVGSSKIITVGFFNKSLAIASFCFSPPDHFSREMHTCCKKRMQIDSTGTC